MLAYIPKEEADTVYCPRVQVRLISYCPKHCSAHPELSGVQALREGEEAEDRGDDGNGLWNAQPFKQPPTVPVPDCPAGCMRALPLQARALSVSCKYKRSPLFQANTLIRSIGVLCCA